MKQKKNTTRPEGQRLSEATATTRRGRPDIAALLKAARAAIKTGQLTDSQRSVFSRLLEMLEHSERRFRSVAQTTRDAIVTIDRQGKVVLWNAGARAMFGRSAGEMIGRRLSTVMPPGRRPMHEEGLGRAVRTGESAMSGRIVQCTGLRKDGSEFPLEFSVTRWQSREREVFFTGIARDITDRQRAQEELARHRDHLEQLIQVRTEELGTRNLQLRIENNRRKLAEGELRRVNRVLKMLGACNEALIKASDEPLLLRDVCRIIVEVGGYRMAWVGLAENDRAKTVRPAACEGLARGYLRKSAISWGDNARGRGPTGAAIRTGKARIARNIPDSSDPAFAPWRAEAVRRGYRSSIALPLTAEQQPFGALNIYSTELDAFDPEEVKLLTELADDLAFGIVAIRTRAERSRAEESLHQSEERLRAVNRQLMATREDEQRRLARELHDSLGQELLGLRLALHNILEEHKEAFNARAPAAAVQLAQTVDNCKRLTLEVRNLCYGLYPISLEAFGLVPAFKQLAQDCKTAIPVHLTCDGRLESRRFSADTEIALFRIAQEALNNAVKYSRASRIDLRLGWADPSAIALARSRVHRVGRQAVPGTTAKTQAAKANGEFLLLEVLDDGVGFNVSSEVGRGLGLSTMRERVGAVDGDLQIESRPGRTCVAVIAPAAPRADD